jgi:hypothetical protein
LTRYEVRNILFAVLDDFQNNETAELNAINAWVGVIFIGSHHEVAVWLWGRVERKERERTQNTHAPSQTNRISFDILRHEFRQDVFW